MSGVREEFDGAEGPFSSTKEDVESCRNLLHSTLPGALNVVSFHRAMPACVEELKVLSRSRTIVTLAGIGETETVKAGLITNDTFLAADGIVERQAKLSLSSGEQRSNVKPGNQLRLFLPRDGSDATRWAILNCHDYSHVDLVLALLEYQIELLVVVAYNNATRLYWEYAVSDIHRLFCYIVVVNVGELGGSGVFAPFRRIGLEKEASIGAGGQLFVARGACEIDATIELDVLELRRLRTTFRDHGFHARYKAGKEVGPNTAVLPSEHFMRTVDRTAGPPPVASIKTIPTKWRTDRVRIAIAQLNSMSIPEYVSTKYRIRDHRRCRLFLKEVNSRLTDLETRCNLLKKMPSGSHLDLLVFPEVFIPRTYAKRQLQAFSDRLGTTIICGVDYPDGGERENANECAIIRPNVAPVFYRKITRSQYDAWRNLKPDRMPLSRGDTLYRFVNRNGNGFGVLICYDFSHLDLITKINLEERDTPLDVLFVVAHNPFGILYRSCCVADAHRFYQYVVMCNVSTFGGSGIFAPRRTSGARQTLLEIGQGTEAIAMAEIDLKALRRARKTDDNNLHRGDFMRRPGIFQG